MISRNSRYATTPRATMPEPGPTPAVSRSPGVAALETATGRVIAYQRRRILPRGQDIPAAREVTVISGDRLDLIAYRTLGDPELYWWIADANDAMNPADLVAMPGRRLRIPLPVTDPRWVAGSAPAATAETAVTTGGDQSPTFGALGAPDTMEIE